MSHQMQSVPASGDVPVSGNDLALFSAQLEDRSAEEILQWAAGRYAPRLTFAASLGLEDCVVIDIIARAGLPIDIFTLDTGLLFPETYALKERIEQRYGVSIRAVTPEFSVPQQAERDGPELWLREPDRCCEMRKVRAAARRPVRIRCLDHRHPPRPDAGARDRASGRLGRPVRPRQGQSIGALDVRPGQSLRQPSTTSRSTRCTTRATRASAACRAPAR